VDPSFFDTLTRRASLLTLGSAGVAAALGIPTVTSAKKKHGKGKNKGKSGDPNALCKKQVGQCTDFFEAACQGNPDCLATVDRCCPTLGSCDLAGFFECVATTE
jgi:hypothetical protein